MWKTWGKRISILLAVLLAAGICRSNEIPERCALCGYLRSHAPCLLNLSTGEMGELAVYDRHPEKVGELAQQQQGGTLCFFPCAGLQAVRDTADWTTVIDVPKTTGRLKKRFFCSACRERLQPYRQTGFVLVDLYQVNAPAIYPVCDDAVYEIRCYKVEIEEGAIYQIKVTGEWQPA